MNLRLLLTAVSLLPLAASAATQGIPLAAGSNLISFQLDPANPAPAAVFGSLGASFVEAATYDNQSKKWNFYRNPSESMDLVSA